MRCRARLPPSGGWSCRCPGRPKSGWQDRAACRTSPPEWFDAETEENAARALAVCAGCPVRRECFAAAAADRAAFGVWGGVDLSAPGRAAVAS